jgi:hypothetical protein
MSAAINVDPFEVPDLPALRHVPIDGLRTLRWLT